MANITDLKFLTLEGLKVVINNLKSLISNVEAKSKISGVTTTSAADKVTINISQGEGTGITPVTKSVDINSASETAAGLMSAEDKTKLKGIAEGAQVNVIEGIVIRGEGDTDTVIEMTTKLGKKLVIDNLKTISATVPTDSDEQQKDAKLAPTAAAVRTFVNDKITSVNNAATELAGKVTKLETAVGDETAGTGILGRLKTAETDIDAVEGRATTLENELNTADTGIKARLTKAEEDIDAAEGRLDTAEDDIDALKGRATALETFIGEDGSRNIYTKTEVDNLQTAQNTTLTDSLQKYADDKVAALKKEILTGDATGDLDKAYDTLLEVANWIKSDTTGTTALTNRVAKNETDIAALTQTVTDNKTAIDGQLSQVNEDIDKNAEDIAALAETVAANETDIEKKVSDLTTAIGNNLDAAKNYTNDEISKLAYVEDINASIKSDTSGNLTLTYTVNGTTDTTKSISFGSLIQESEITALFAVV